MTAIGIDAYPLYWPEGWPRTDRYRRRDSKFKATFVAARDDLLRNIRLLGGTKPIISTNVALRRDSLPLAGQREPDDSGVALYFTRRGKQQVLACDTYLRVWENLRGLGLSVEALRALDRHGASTILDRAFLGFAALPPAGEHWSKVLGVPSDSSIDAIEAAYRSRLAAAHPDRGGSTEEFQRVQRALSEAMSSR